MKKGYHSMRCSGVKITRKRIPAPTTTMAARRGGTKKHTFTTTSTLLNLLVTRKTRGLTGISNERLLHQKWTAAGHAASSVRLCYLLLRLFYHWLYMIRRICCVW